MKFKGKFVYREYINGNLSDKYVCICEIVDKEDIVTFKTNNFKKDNILLSVLKNNDIIYVEKTGAINYKITHQEKKEDEFEITVNMQGNVSSFDSVVKTKYISYEYAQDNYNVEIEFLRENDIVRCVYEIFVKGRSERK